jgi:hypothetical protein
MRSISRTQSREMRQDFSRKLSGARTGEGRERADELLRVNESARSELTWLDEQEPEEIKRYRDVEVRKGDSEARS